jgi:hypothetical protein
MVSLNLLLWSLVAILGIATLYLWFVRKKEPQAPQQASK